MGEGENLDQTAKLQAVDDGCFAVNVDGIRVAVLARAALEDALGESSGPAQIEPNFFTSVAIFEGRQRTGAKGVLLPPAPFVLEGANAIASLNVESARALAGVLLKYVREEERAQWETNADVPRKKWLVRLG